MKHLIEHVKKFKICLVLIVYILLLNGIAWSEVENSPFSSLSSEEKKSLRNLVPDVISIESLPKTGVNKSYIVTGSQGKFFLKFYTDRDRDLFNQGNGRGLVKNFASLHEAASSSLANYISSGLVPAGKSDGPGIVFPIVNIDHDKKIFKSVYPNMQEEDIFDALTFEQKCQMFILLLSDLALNNPDTHSFQFGVTREGKMVGFDKGRSYLGDVFRKSKISLFSIKFGDLISDSKVYHKFVRRLKSERLELTKIVSSTVVQEAIKRIHGLGSKKNIADIRALLRMMSPLMTYIRFVAKNQDDPTVDQIQESYIKSFSDLIVFLENEFKDVDPILFHPKDKKSMDDVSSEWINVNGQKVRSITFNPKKNHPRIVSSLEQGGNGAQVSKLLSDSGAIAGINGGFFNFGPGVVPWSGTWLLRKVQQRVQQLEPANFPSAILKTAQNLVSDTNQYLPAIGWTSDGSRVVIGNLRVQWYARDLNQEIKLRRVKPLDLSNPSKYIRVASKIKGNMIDEVEVKRGFVQSGSQNKSVQENRNYSSLVNVFEIEDEPKEQNLNFKIGSTIKIFYRWDSSEENVPIKKDFNGLDYVLSGGAILILNHVVQHNFPDFTNPTSDAPRTGVCIKQDKWVLLTVQAASLSQFSNIMKNLQCVDGISLDGGGSTTSYVIKNDEPEVTGSDRFVSDVVAVLPALNDGLSVHIKNTAKISSEWTVAKIKEYLEKQPQAVRSLDEFEQTPLQALLLENNDDINPDVLDLLISKMEQQDFLIQNQFGETLAHTAIRLENFDLAKKIIEKGGGIDNFYFQRGFEEQTICELMIKLHQINVFNFFIQKCISTSISILLGKINDIQISVQSRKLGIIALADFVKVGHGYSQAIEIASQYIQDMDKSLRGGSLFLFSALFDKSIGFSEASKVVSQLVHNSDPEITATELNLLNNLVARGHAFDQAYKAIIEKYHPRGINFARLLLALVKNGYKQSYEFANTYAVELSNRNFNHSDGVEHEIFLALVDKEYSDVYQNIDLVLKKFTPYACSDVTRMAPLIVSLVEHGLFYEEASKWVTDGPCHSSDRKYVYSVERNFDEELMKGKIIRALLGKGQALAAASAYIKEIFLNSYLKKSEYEENIDLIHLALDVFKSLLDKGYEIDQAQSLAAALTSYDLLFLSSYYIDNIAIRWLIGLKIYKILVENGVGGEEARIAVFKSFRTSLSSRAQLVLLSLVNIFFNSPHSAYGKMEESDSDTLKLAALDLLQSLVEKGLAYEEAIIAIKKYRFSSNPKIKEKIQMIKELLKKR